MEEERKVLEEKQYKIETKYNKMKEYYENEFNECISKDGLSQEEQQDCYKRKHQNLDEVETEKSKLMEEAQKYFDEQIALQCSICLEELDSEDDIKVLPCLHEFHNKCIQDMIEKRCPLCRKDCNIKLKDPINLESPVTFSRPEK